MRHLIKAERKFFVTNFQWWNVMFEHEWKRIVHSWAHENCKITSSLCESFFINLFPLLGGSIRVENYGNALVLFLIEKAEINFYRKNILFQILLEINKAGNNMHENVFFAKLWIPKIITEVSGGELKIH